MNNFELDPRLAGENIDLGNLSVCQLLLVNNSEVAWFILVPRVAGAIELYELDDDTQQQVLRDINLVSRRVKQHFTVDKLNVAAIGNIVEQLHIHVIGRYRDDFAWPGVVWGTAVRDRYTKEEINRIASLFDER